MPRRRARADALSPWPGYVDALSTLLMVTIFVLLVFVLAQGFLSVALNGRDRAIDRMQRQLSEITDALALARHRADDLAQAAARATAQAQAAGESRDALAAAALGLRRDAAQRDDEAAGLRAERDRLMAALSDARTELAAQAGRDAAARAADAADAVRARTASDAQLADDAHRLQAAAAQRDSLAAALRLIAADRDRKRDAAIASAAQVASLSQQVETLHAQMAQMAAALDLAKTAAKTQDAQIAGLDQKLSAALASKVEELKRYRSEFFGRLSRVLAGRPGIAVVGDRFVFQSEVLFPAGSADLTAPGRSQIDTLATTLKSIAGTIPPDVNWLLRIDGHADRQKMAHGAFASNWELSAQRAINVVKRLAADGIAPNRLAAAGFGEYQPLDPAATAAAYARNRRIEIRLTDR